MKLNENQLYTTNEVAKILKVSTITVKRYIAQNKIPSIKFNGLRRIDGKDLSILFKKLKNHKKNYGQFN